MGCSPLLSPPLLPFVGGGRCTVTATGLVIGKAIRAAYVPNCRPRACSLIRRRGVRSGPWEGQAAKLAPSQAPSRSREAAAGLRAQEPGSRRSAGTGSPLAPALPFALRFREQTGAVKAAADNLTVVVSLPLEAAVRRSRHGTPPGGGVGGWGWWCDDDDTHHTHTPGDCPPGGGQPPALQPPSAATRWRTRSGSAGKPPPAPPPPRRAPPRPRRRGEGRGGRLRPPPRQPPPAPPATAAFGSGKGGASGWQRGAGGNPLREIVRASVFRSRLGPRFERGGFPGC